MEKPKNEQRRVGGGITVSFRNNYRRDRGSLLGYTTKVRRIRSHEE